MKSVRDIDVKGKKVFLRVDFNVPMQAGEITDDNRIKAALPTIQYLIDHGAKVIIGTHLGKPEGERKLEYSTVPLAQRLAKLLNRRVSGTDFVVGPEVNNLVSELRDGDVLVLGNLRFDPGEEKNDDAFAQRLAELADLYVNDAFAVSHRSNASVDQITMYLPSYAGFRLESETTTLQMMLAEPEKPFYIIIGGVKIKDKAGVINQLAPKAEAILVGGGVANTFLKARGENIGASVYDEDMVDECKKMLEQFGSKLIMPVDGVLENTPDGSFKILDLGPQTVKYYKSELARAKTVFWNGNLGFTEDDRYVAGTKGIAEFLSENKGQITAVLAGGDTVGFFDTHNLIGGVSFASTGGGAALEFLAGEKLPGVAALEREPVVKK